MRADELFGDLPEQAVPARALGGPRLRQPERMQLAWDAVDVDSLLPGEHRARIIWAYVERLDLQALYEPIQAREGTPGHPPIDPRLMLALWLYATSEGVGSARLLARLCESENAYRWLCGGVSVNYHTLADFRVAHPKLLDDLLAANVAALAASGLIDFDTLAQDGLRLRAAAGSGSFRRRATLEQRLRQSRELVERLKQEVEADPEAGNRRIRAARQRAAREAAARAQAALDKLAELEKQRKRRQKTHAKQTARQDEPRTSLTDPEARVIKMADGGFRPGYNMQLASALEQQIIVGVDATASGSDAGLARPMLEALGEKQIKPFRYLADGGYTKNEDIEWAAQQGIEIYCPPPRSKHGTDPFAPRQDDPSGVVAWRLRMHSETGKSIYRRRAIHECINARLRQWKLIQITVRSLAKARTVLLWFALANNILGGHRLAAAAAAR